VPALVSAASINIHGGVDGWGRPFDVVGACRRADSDVLVIQESFTPDDRPGLAEEVADALGYRVWCAPMGRARRYPPPTESEADWGPLWRPRAGVGVKAVPDGRRDGAERGTLGLALLSRLPTSEPELVDLGRWMGDPVRRVALLARVDHQGGDLVVVGTHMSHLRHGSLLQLQRLRRRLPRPDVPAVLLGDMNLWGPPLSLSFPGWSRAVRGRSWPSWRPLFQIDHILVSRAVAVARGEVMAPVGSDHLPVRAVLSVR
jgi:endonuclease/exonuclease/phosphatase family metal-dependent hydrolase